MPGQTLASIAMPSYLPVRHLAAMRDQNGTWSTPAGLGGLSCQAEGMGGRSSTGWVLEPIPLHSKH